MLKYIDKVIVRFAPLSPKSRSARTFLQAVSANKYLTVNPKAVIEVDASDKVPKPSVYVQYVDKKVLEFDTETMDAQEIIRDIGRHSKRLRLEADIKAAA
ncbi:hypothetical protein HK097_002345 [Rhizophlyctis rosea]|uniref:Large ribosomal subunit protein mL53 n=1 Tax=Rhizophlyctis rosea TaxID=64517 RepID=A0AAD5SJQ7_9FUNG|nr:hypothetical protein HK097_002345 [Rhizophlyctis rosea]